MKLRAKILRKSDSEDYGITYETLGGTTFTISIPVIIQKMEERKLTDPNGDTGSSYEVRYDNGAMERAIKQEIFKQVGAFLSKTFVDSGSSSLIGFPSSFTTKEYKNIQKGPILRD